MSKSAFQLTYGMALADIKASKSALETYEKENLRKSRDCALTTFSKHLKRC